MLHAHAYPRGLGFCRRVPRHLLERGYDKQEKRDCGVLARAGVPRADTGFPGSPNTSRCSGPSTAGHGTVAKVVGFPGFNATRPKCMDPARVCWITPFSKSFSPIDTPPCATCEIGVAVGLPL